MTYPLPSGAIPPNPSDPTPPAPQPPAPVNPTPPAPQPPADPNPQPPADPADEPLRPEGLRALQSEREARKEAERQLAAANAQLSQIQQAGMTDLQRAQAERDSFQQQYEAATARERRSSIAIEFGIPANKMVFLNGSTEDQLREQAKELKELIDSSVSAATAPPTFVPNPAQPAGNVTPPPSNTATVSAGRDLYKQHNS